MLQFQSDIERSLWQSIYLEQIGKVDQSKDERIIKSFVKMAVAYADESIYEFRARAGKHEQILPVVHGTNDDVFQFTHDAGLNPFDN